MHVAERCTRSSCTMKQTLVPVRTCCKSKAKAKLFDIHAKLLGGIIRALCSAAPDLHCTMILMLDSNTHGIMSTYARQHCEPEARQRLPFWICRESKAKANLL